MYAEYRARVLNDPLATPEEVRNLGHLDALRHINCPAFLWWKAAATYPLEAQASPLYSLFMLESPERWVELEHRHRDAWIDAWIKFNLCRWNLFLRHCIVRVPYAPVIPDHIATWIAAQRLAAAVAQAETGWPNYLVAFNSQRGDEWDAVWNRERAWQWALIQQIEKGLVC